MFGNNATVDSLTISIGYVDTFFTESSNSFKGGLTPVSFTPQFQINQAPSNGWIKFPITTGSFIFDPSRNFAVEISYPGHPTGGCRLSMTLTERVNGIVDTTKFRGAAVSKISGFSPFWYGLDLGFDQGTSTIVTAVSKEKLRIYPNPNAGVFTLQLSNDGSSKTSDIDTRNCVGRSVYKEHMECSQTHCKKVIDLSDLPKGVYSVIATINGAVNSSKLVIW